MSIGILNMETCVRLAHKGVYPIGSDHGYCYLTDNDGKMIGTSHKHKYAEYLLSIPPKENDELNLFEKEELKSLNLL